MVGNFLEDNSWKSESIYLADLAERINGKISIKTSRKFWNMLGNQLSNGRIS